MIGYKYLIDSNIIIYHLNGDNIANQFLINNEEFSAISIITYIEVLSFNFGSENKSDKVKKFLDQFEIINTDKNIALKALENRKIKKVKLPDNIIVSTAQLSDLILVTRNVKDFTNLEVNIFNPFEEIQ